MGDLLWQRAREEAGAYPSCYSAGPEPLNKGLEGRAFKAIVGGVAPEQIGRLFPTGSSGAGGVRLSICILAISKRDRADVTASSSGVQSLTAVSIYTMSRVQFS